MKNEQLAETSQWSFSVVLEPDPEDGGYVVYCPTLKGCWSQGDTVDEAMHNIVDAIGGWMVTHIERSLDIPQLTSINEQITGPLTLSVQVP